MRGDGDGAPTGGEADGGWGFLEGDMVEDGAAAEVGLEARVRGVIPRPRWTPSTRQITLVSRQTKLLRT
jgi:hypothetical protein